ncbi:hypothetical protein PHYSODRAFT_339821 [Phytophthora sojae]|uniref:RxLR effector protein n=1 Tax=Phytophthora sojae (strain P6497) TaxID=1094619 RepID=G5A7Q8_PHYSP|nr:hypothetical protein PHYSODRAFT_339821 [Phytophthora sojae]EGZ07934.1 hypothetical protein PHYSODRAFT_339821 [Phytophthora sojae]|eukprot:XP_009536106.1 hypothetical protein PHYSODRAFT_339821 [Phytophthora sojae]
MAVLLFTSTDAVSNSGIISTLTTSTTATARNLLSLEDVERKKTSRSTDLSPATEEERAGGAIAAATGGAAAGNSVVVPNKEQNGKTVTVTKYHNNGLLQRLTRWLKRKFGGAVEPSKQTSKQTSKTRRLRQSSKTS